MSRTRYSEDEDFSGQFALWEANLRRSLKGKAGRRALEDLRTALLAMPRKRLIENRLAENGDVCTVGALLLVRGYTPEALEAMSLPCVCFHVGEEHDDAGVCRTCAGYRALLRERAERGDLLIVLNWNPLAPVACQSFRPDPDADSEEIGLTTESIAVRAGVPRMVAWHLQAENDDGEYGLGGLTPEARYSRVLADVERELRA